MPFARVGTLTLYYETHGQGPNLALIEGIGYHTWMWYRQLPDLAAHFRVLIYDNRGVGRSDMPQGPYSHAQNAADLAGLLDALDIQKTHVLGVSMGGFIAQEFALAYPERVDKLVLVATGFGGPRMVPVTAEALHALAPHPELSVEERIRHAMPVAFANSAWPEQHRDEFEQIVAWRLTYPQPAHAARAQASAALTFNVDERLHDLRVPTLVIAGACDRVVPPANARLLADAIPGARLSLIEDAGHLVNIEQSQRFNQEVMEFLWAQ